MQGSHHHIQLRQHFIRKVQRAVCIDLQLRAVQQPDAAAQLVLRRSHFRGLRAQALHAQAVCNCQAARVVCDRQNFNAARLGCLRQLQHALLAVRPAAVRVQIGAQLRTLQQHGQAAVLRRLHLALVFAQLRRNERQPQRRIHLFLAGAQQLFAVGARQRMLGKRKIFGARNFTQAHIVVLGAGGILQCRAKALWRMHPQLRAHAGVKLHAGLGAALCQHMRHPAIICKRCQHRRCVLGRHQQIHIAHQRAHAPHAAAGSRRRHAGQRAQHCQQLAGKWQRVSQQQLAGAALERLEPR